MNEPTKPSASDKQRGIGVLELLFAVATLATGVLVAAMTDPKIPRSSGD